MQTSSEEPRDRCQVEQLTDEEVLRLIADAVSSDRDRSVDVSVGLAVLGKRGAAAALAQLVEDVEWDGAGSLAMREAVCACGNKIIPLLESVRGEFAIELIEDVRNGLGRRYK